MPGWRCFWPKGFSARSRRFKPYCGRHQLLQGGRYGSKESWAGRDLDLAATGETQKAGAEGLGKARGGTMVLWLGGEPVTRWGCLKGQLFVFLEPEV